jgi:hypothetical protein
LSQNRKRLDEAVNDKLSESGAPRLSGSVVINQGDYSVTEHRLAFGAIVLHFEILDTDQLERTALVHAYFTDRYAWHPEEMRNTKCIHEAADRMKAVGAKEFDMVGDARVAVPLAP